MGRLRSDLLSHFLGALWEEALVALSGGWAIVESVRCGGNDSRFGFYAAERNSLDGDTTSVLSGDEDRFCVKLKKRKDIRKK